MKKAISVLLCIVLVVSGVFAMAGCTKQKQITNDIVLITDGGAVNDKGYNQSAWDGVNSYANDNKMTARYYQPVLDENDELTSDNVEKYVKLAQDNGAKYIVFPGEKFEVIAYDLLAGIFAFEYTVYLCDQYIHIKRFADVIVRSNLQAF